MTALLNSLSQRKKVQFPFHTLKDGHGRQVQQKRVDRPPRAGDDPARRAESFGHELGATQDVISS